MKRATAAAFALTLGVGLAPTAWAQTSVPGPGATQGQPQAGSMAENQVRSHLEANGLRNIRDLTMLSDGTWRAQVTSGSGGNVLATVDAQGNIMLNTGVAPAASGTQAQPQATSMAEDQVRSRLEAAGLRNIRDLTMQNDGTWRAQVTTGSSGNVRAMVDAQGNITLNTGVAPAAIASQAQPQTASMAETQARSRLEAAGLQNIRDLTMLNDGTWRAQVTSAQGSNVQAMVDAQGNVTLNTGLPAARP
ncbi:hypothetical protein AAFN86_28580 [Roseomonas sp. CAU 1739]|uniref:hypothetical protein n=1 Tax=Roseomonas sp. CAU 1739 TaxID=3140364 RepID=UPI00325C32F6